MGLCPSGVRVSFDPVHAQWLQDATLWQLAEDAGRAARWGASAITAERETTLATSDDAAAEGARQLAFLGGPLAIDEVALAGAWRQFEGQVITLSCNQLGYDGGLNVFLIEARDDHATGFSTLTVIRRL